MLSFSFRIVDGFAAVLVFLSVLSSRHAAGLQNQALVVGSARSGGVLLRIRGNAPPGLVQGSIPRVAILVFSHLSCPPISSSLYWQVGSDFGKYAGVIQARWAHLIKHLYFTVGVSHCLDTLLREDFVCNATASLLPQTSFLPKEHSSKAQASELTKLNVNVMPHHDHITSQNPDAVGTTTSEKRPLVARGESTTPSCGDPQHDAAYQGRLKMLPVHCDDGYVLGVNCKLDKGLQVFLRSATARLIDWLWIGDHDFIPNPHALAALARRTDYTRLKNAKTVVSDVGQGSHTLGYGSQCKSVQHIRSHGLLSHALFSRPAVEALGEIAEADGAYRTAVFGGFHSQCDAVLQVLAWMSADQFLFAEQGWIYPNDDKKSPAGERPNMYVILNSPKRQYVRGHELPAPKFRASPVPYRGYNLTAHSKRRAAGRPWEPYTATQCYHDFGITTGAPKPVAVEPKTLK